MRRDSHPGAENSFLNVSHVFYISIYTSKHIIFLDKFKGYIFFNIKFYVQLHKFKSNTITFQFNYNYTSSITIINIHIMQYELFIQKGYSVFAMCELLNCDILNTVEKLVQDITFDSFFQVKYIRKNTVINHNCAITLKDQL